MIVSDDTRAQDVTLDPYQLTKKIGFWEGIELDMAYIHGRAKDYYEACRKTRGDQQEKYMKRLGILSHFWVARKQVNMHLCARAKAES